MEEMVFHEILNYIKLLFKFNGETMQILMNFEYLGKYFACAYIKDCEDDAIIKRYFSPTEDETFSEKYGTIPFNYNEENYDITLILSDHSLMITKKDDEDFEEYSDFVLSF